MTRLARGLRLPDLDMPCPDHAAIGAYLRASGDTNPLHHDARTARQAGFADVLVPGMMIQGQMAEILARWAQGGRIVSFGARFVLPVPVGSTLRFEGRVATLRADGAVILRLKVMLGAQVAVLGEAVVHDIPTDPA